MAERRMFAKTIIDSDAFLDMPQSTQLLYFHLSMRADDDGFINKPKSIMREVGCKDDDLKILAVKKFIIPFDSGVVVIKHWKIHNYIAKDRYNQTKYKNELSMLNLDENNAYSLQCNDLETVSTECIQPVYECETQVRLGKDSIGKVRLEKKEEPESVFFQESNQVQSNQESDFPFRDPPPVQNPNRVNTDTTNRIETARTIWNATDGLPKYRFMAISIPPDNLHPILRMLGQYSDDEVQQAIRNYADIISRSDLNPFPKYTNFAGFLAKGIELYCDEAKPYERCKKASGFETAQEKEDRERKAALAYSRKLDEEYQRQQELAECEDD